MTSSDKPMRAKDLDTMSGLRRRIVELEIENKSLREQIPPVHCLDCRHAFSPDGIFRRCKINGMKVVCSDGFCSDGERKNKCISK